jgi:hypothetical protein
VKQHMKRTRRIGLLWLLLSSAVFIVWGSAMMRNPPGRLVDFKAVYYGARCLIQHSDPYRQSEFLSVYQADGGEFPSDPVMSQLVLRGLLVCINLPTALLVVAPIALLPWGPAHLLWLLLVAASLTLAAFLAWLLAQRFESGVSLFLICIVLANSEIIFAGGNAAGIAVSLCVVAVWCFLKQRFVLAGVLCMAISLALKPHDAGLVWLFFLLAGGVYRKRALQTLVVVIALGLPAVLWVSYTAPNWMQELHSNLLETSARGDLNDPGPASITFRSADKIIDLQSVISVFRDDPRIYNPASYLLCGVLLAVWSVSTLRSRLTPARALLALAVIAAFSMLPVYHRQHDAKLLLLTVPACAMLWAEGGLTRWIALLLNTAGIVLTSDIPSASLVILTNNLHPGTVGILAQIQTVVLMGPAPIILLALGIFYLWVYVRRSVPDAREAKLDRTPGWIQPHLLPAQLSSGVMRE